MNLKKYRSVQDELNLLKYNLNELKKLEDNIYKDVKNIENDCEHNLILVYDVEYHLINSSSTMRKGNCLCCNKEFRLLYELSVDNKKTEMVYKKIDNGKVSIVDKDNIIDVTDVVSRNYFGSKLFLDAKDILNELEIDNVDKEDLKKSINNTLVDKYQKNDSLKKVYKID